jgi:23S rRNA U2552 (ribose-2'-O)-methylase RlmE/FtsJ
MLFRLESKDSLENIDKNISISLNTNNIPEVPQEIYGFNSKLNVFRNFIDNINSDVWKKVRWYINSYDFQVKDPIINRAFYKYWEIINEFEIFEDYNENEIILHCAEAPGGFIQGTNIYLQIDRISKPLQIKDSLVDNDGFTFVKNKRKINKNDNYRIYSISLNKELSQYRNYNLPSYNKNILNKYLCITYGKDNTGDINNLKNLDYIKNITKKNFYLITADGGFDEGTDFNNKEQLHYHLILNEIYAAITMQQKNGHFILKVFDIMTETSVHLLYLLSKCYQDVFIYKPKTSRPTNSEKYIVCKYFNIDDNLRNIFCSNIKKLSETIKESNIKFISFKLFNEIPDTFINNIKEVNTELLNIQCSHLENAIELSNNTDFLNNYDQILEKSLKHRKEIFQKWEELYNLNSYV